MVQHNLIMKIGLIGGKEFSFYVKDNEAVENIKNEMKYGSTELIDVIPTLSIRSDQVVSVEIFEEELKG